MVLIVCLEYWCWLVVSFDVLDVVVSLESLFESVILGANIRSLYTLFALTTKRFI